MTESDLYVTSVLLPLTVIICGVLLCEKLLGVQQDASEPPFVPSAIPYIGHIIGLFWYKNRYYTKLSGKHRPKIYSLAMPRGRLYVVNSPDLVLSLQKQPRTVSFWLVESKFTAKLGGLSKTATEMLLDNVGTDLGGKSLLIEGLKATHVAMMPGTAINDMLYLTSQTFAIRLNRFETDSKRRRVDLWSWLRHEVTMGTTESVYGPKNPYRDPEVEKGFWNFADNGVMLLAGVSPNLFAAKAHGGRERVVAALEEYFAAASYNDGSHLIKVRARFLQRNFARNDIARFECVNGIAILVNTVPTAFWTVYHTFSDPAVLEAVRKEASSILMLEETGGTVTRMLDFSNLKRLPVIASVIQESLRHRTSGAGARILVEDTMLENRYLLKKGSYLTIPGHELHFDQDAWGESANDFDFQRFVGSSKRIHSGKFRGFGGGANLCPGRLFAMTEISAIVAMLALKYDMTTDSGKWIDPGQDFGNVTLAIAPPKRNTTVEIIPREGWDGGLWKFRF